MIHFGTTSCRTSPVVLCLTFLFIMAGCRGSDNQLGRQRISGKVSLDGKPVVTGSIQFSSLPGASQEIFSGCLIKDGSYSLPEMGGLPPGEYRVSISSAAPSAPVSSDPEEAMKAAENPATTPELIPEKYNSKSELTIEVEKSGKSVFDFDLKS